MDLLANHSKAEEVVVRVGTTTLKCRWLYLYNMVRSQHMQQEERNLNDGGRRLRHLQRGRLGEKEVSRKRQSRAPQSTAEHVKAPFIERRGSYVQYTNPYHPYREAEDSRAQQGSVEKGGRKRAKRGKWTGFPIIALHSTL